MTGVAATGALTMVLVAGQQPGASMPAHDMPMRGMKMTTAEKIANAASAAPASVSAKATVLDWPSADGARPMVLRPGSNGWSCFPDMPESKGNDPMCLDTAWMKWMDAYLAHTTPQVPDVGVGYMIGDGGGWSSNTDPFAMKETSDNQWGHHAPHLMIVVPDVKLLSGLSSDPKNGGPYVMFAGTPYAHIMAPVK
jgi:hypothetical protein